MKAGGCTRRAWLAAAGGLAACSPPAEAPPPAAWVGAAHERGHALRDGPVPAAAGTPRLAQVLVLGAGIAGLAAARAFQRQGVDDVHLLELEDRPGGNSRGHAMAGMACPLGAHYLPLPGEAAHEVAEWLHEIGLLKTVAGRTVPDERHLCHSPQERLFVDGAWAEGLLPPVEPRSAAAQQMRGFAQAVAQLRRPGAFTLPAHRSRWSAEHAALDALPFARWLDGQGFTAAPLRWYLDYCCRDDYGAAADTVSAWAGLHYFASRHGFHAPGEADAEREGVFTWPEGNAWLAQRLIEPLGERLHTGRVAWRVSEQRHGVEVLAWRAHDGGFETWEAQTVVLALPLVVAARIVQNPPAALREAAARLAYAPWLVANLQLDAPLLDRPGAPPSWDNVVYGSEGLGYVDAGHQRLGAVRGATVLSAYRALPVAARPELLAAGADEWLQRVLADLARAHPDLPRRVRRADLMRWGHAMAIPRPGLQRHPALVALRAQRGRLRFAHADLAGCSLFEESFTAGCEVASPAPARK